MAFKFQEMYLLTIVDDLTRETHTTLVPSRLALANTLQLIENTPYSVLSLQVLPPVDNYIEFLKILKDESKPKGLNFGQED